MSPKRRSRSTVLADLKSKVCASPDIACEMASSLGKFEIRRNHESGSLPLEKHCRRNVESFAQFLDVGFVQSAFVVKNLGDDAFGTKASRVAQTAPAGLRL